ncbi:MAG: hypothetical protein P9E24_01280 [Candidatus Competibacter sp.]|nr:hypothetical protein [Candidatus Competibacter sp.]MDG4583384.1 hypothetical protein [Candidatus Competibacter sp.]
MPYSSSSSPVAGLILSAAMLMNAPTLACGDFGPDYGEPCPPVTPVPVERIPLAGWDRPLWLGADADGNPIPDAPVQGFVVANDFAVLVATLPNEIKIIGTSNQCIQASCPWLGNAARQALEHQADLVMRVLHQTP